MKYNSSKYIGLQSGYLTVVSYEHGKFLCRCECGRTVRVDPWIVIHQKKKTCSSPECRFFHKCLAEASTSHGLTGTRLYTIWNNMIARCYHPQNPNYKNYGARGVRVCDDWRYDVHAFIKWAMKNGYGDNLTIDRINVNGDYEPSNCRWADYKTQYKNRRDYIKTPRRATKHIWTIDGETKSGVEWCKLYEVSFPTVIYRIKTFGIAPKEALTMKNKQPGRPRKRKAE